MIGGINQVNVFPVYMMKLNVDENFSLCAMF